MTVEKGDIFEFLPEVQSKEEAHQMIEHLEDVSDTMAEITEDIHTGNLVYSQSHVLKRVSEILRELHLEADEYGEREAEMMALAILLHRESEEDIW